MALTWQTVSGGQPLSSDAAFAAMRTSGIDFANSIKGVGDFVTAQQVASEKRNLVDLQNKVAMLGNDPAKLAAITPEQFSADIAKYGGNINLTDANAVLPKALLGAREATDATNSFEVRQNTSKEFGKTVEGLGVIRAVKALDLLNKKSEGDELFNNALANGLFPDPTKAVADRNSGLNTVSDSELKKVMSQAAINPTKARSDLDALVSAGKVTNPAVAYADFDKFVRTQDTGASERLMRGFKGEYLSGKPGSKEQALARFKDAANRGLIPDPQQALESLTSLGAADFAEVEQNKANASKVLIGQVERLAITDPATAQLLLEKGARDGIIINPTKVQKDLTTFGTEQNNAKIAAYSQQEDLRTAKEMSDFNEQLTNRIKSHQNDLKTNDSHDRAMRSAIATVNATRSTSRKIPLTAEGFPAENISQADTDLVQRIYKQASKGLGARVPSPMNDTELASEFSTKINALNLPQDMKQKLLDRVGNFSTAKAPAVGQQLAFLEQNQKAVDAAFEATKLADEYKSQKQKDSGLGGGFINSTEGTKAVADEMRDLGIGEGATGDAGDVRDWVMEQGLPYAKEHNVPAAVFINLLRSTSREGGALSYFGLNSDNVLGKNMKKALEKYIASTKYVEDTKLLGALEKDASKYRDGAYEKSKATGFTVKRVENKEVPIPTTLTKPQATKK